MNKKKNNYTIEQLEILRDKIQSIENDEIHHLEILKILKQSNVTFSENNNGVFVNMNHLTDDILKKVSDYLVYIEKQNKKFDDIENKKNEFKKDLLLL